MEVLYLVAGGLVLYFVSDWLLTQIERRRGEVLEHRTPIFFAIYLASLLLAFALIRDLLGV